MKSSKILLNISALFCYLYGALYIFSLVFIPIGIYCFIAAKRFATKADHIDDYFSLDKKVFKNYVIFASIACFPLGMLSIIPYCALCGNNIKVQSNQSSATVDESNKVAQDNSNNEEEKVSQVEIHEETEEEKIEKFKKLENFREKGLITDDELEMAREQLFGKKD